MAFHRLAVPTYFGGLPGGYDYINTPSLNGDPGAASSMDGKKGSGPNQGTYFVAFGEDATANNTNRGLKALSENTDILDNLFHRDIALTERTADVLAGAPVSSIVVTGQIFVGEFGVANTQAQRDLLISILDNSDNEIITTAGTTVKALLIHDGASANVVGTQTSGFYATPTVNLNVPIPAGVTYHVVYGVRSNLATLPKDAFTNVKIRGAQEVSGEVERVLRDLHADISGSPVWNGPWLATIASLARTGLDGRYRLASVTDPGSTMDTPGNGGFIKRDGPAVRLRAPTYLLDTVGVVGIDKYPDPLFAMLRVERETTVTGTAYDLTRGGDHGLVQESPYHNYADANEVAYGHVTGPLLLDVIPRSIAASTIGGAATLTRINSATVASVNPDALTDTTSRRTLQVGGSDFVRDGSSRTALRKTDLIEVINNATGLVVGTYRVDSILSATRFTVKALTGALPPIGPSGAAAAVRLRWLQPTMSLGGTHRAATADAQGVPHFFVAQPSFVTSNYDSNAIVPYAAFLAASSRRDIGITNQPLLQALAWGGFGLDGLMNYTGFLYGDGSMAVTGGRQRLSMISTLTQVANVVNGGGSVSFDPMLGGRIKLQPTTVWTTDPTTITFAFNFANGFQPTEGDEVEVSILVPSGTTDNLTINWPADFRFSDGDSAAPIAVPGASVTLTRWKFTFMHTLWFGMRVDYSF